MSGRPLSVALAVVLAAAFMFAEENRPEFPSVQLTDAKGQVFEIKDFAGAVTILNFWAVWCGPCRAELPELQKLYKELGGKGLAVLAISVDTQKQAVQPFLDRLGVTLPIAFLDQKTQAELGIDRIPFTVLLDRKGRVARVYPGFAPKIMADLREQAAALLAEPAAAGGK